MLKWFKQKMHEFLLFLEYPIDYIVEFGDKLKQQTLGGKALTVLKLVVTVYLCYAISELLVIAFLGMVFLAGNAFEYEDDFFLNR